MTGSASSAKEEDLIPNSTILPENRQTEEDHTSKLTLDQQTSGNECYQSGNECDRSGSESAEVFAPEEDISAEHEKPDEIIPKPFTKDRTGETASTDDTQPSSIVQLTADEVPREVLHLINGKSANDVVNIINGQLAELKAIETLRDVEEECLDELTNEIIAKITKERII